ncbi:MAG: F0F1 ATP synthase subunit delta [Burkholderiales bacterium]|jgi:F-type H+-transporting ATPase subunit delta
MAELATLARPYAEALFQAVRQQGSQVLAEVSSQLRALAVISADPPLRQFADHPKVQAQQVFDVLALAVQQPLLDSVQNLLRTVIDNGRLSAMPQIASQYQDWVNSQAGIHDAHIASAFPIEPGLMNALMQALEKRFGLRLNPIVTLEPELIGGIRVMVGDEVLDTSIKARLKQMNAALSA